MSGKKVIILGALSSIAEATARVHAERGDRLVLVARNSERLERLRDDLMARGAADCALLVFDLADVSDPEARISEMVAPVGGGFDVAYICYGVLGDQRAAETNLNAAQVGLQVNFTSAAVWSLGLANKLEAQNSGVLVVITSVAGVRGRQSNYIYGAAKSGLTTLVEGVAHRLAKGKARAVAVRLGTVDTPMTANIERKGSLLLSKPEDIAHKLVAISEKPGWVSPFVPWYWAPIMTLIRWVPSFIFHRTKL